MRVECTFDTRNKYNKRQLYIYLLRILTASGLELKSKKGAEVPGSPLGPGGPGGPRILSPGGPLAPRSPFSPFNANANNFTVISPPADNPEVVTTTVNNQIKNSQISKASKNVNTNGHCRFPSGNYKGAFLILFGNMLKVYI
uniref:Uncharacterized protein n=1 Tax=Glossina palpalis gambiensis TaxID=67801 RepID=A0A1B0AW79_9MUSC